MHRCHCSMQVVSFKTPKGPKVAIYSKKSYFSEKIIPFSYLLLAKSMKFILKLKNHTRVASVSLEKLWLVMYGILNQIFEIFLQLDIKIRFRYVYYIQYTLKSSLNKKKIKVGSWTYIPVVWACLVNVCSTWLGLSFSQYRSGNLTSE